MKSCATNFSQYSWPELLLSGAHIQDLFSFSTNKFNRMHSFVISYEIRYANQACERPVIQLVTWVMDLINAGSKVVTVFFLPL